MAALEHNIKIKIDSSGAKRNVDSLDRSVDNLDNTAKKTNDSFGKLKIAVAAVAAALQIRQIAQYADAFTSIQNQIRQTTNSTEQLTKRTADLLDVSNRSRVSFQATSELYTQLVLSTENLNLSTEEQLRLTETISKSFAVSGKSAAESAGAIRQLGQAFASGTLRGDEFNSIAEGAPEIMRALQRSLKLTQGELRALAATGGITSEILVTALSGAAEVIDNKMSKATKTLAQSFQEAENNAISFVGASGLVKSTMSSAGDAVVFLSKNLDTIANVVLVASIVGFGKLSASIIASTITYVQNNLAARESALAALAVAKTQQASALAFFQSATGATKGSIAVKQLTVANIALANASRAVTAQVGLASGAMALLGGPLGVVLIAATAIAFFATTAKDAKDPVSGLTKEVNDMVSSFANLNQGQIEAKLINSIAAVDQLKKKIAEANANPLKGSSLLGGSQNALDKLNKQLKEAIDLRDALFAAGLSAGRTPTDQSDVPENRGESSKAEPASKEQDPAILAESFKTANLREQLNERLAIQKLYGELMLQEFSTLAEEERAIAQFNRDADLVELESKKTQSLIDFELRRQQVILEGEDKAAIMLEINNQELIAKAQFEADKLDIERESSEESKRITEAEEDFKRNVRDSAFSAAISGLSIFGGKALKIQQKFAKINAIRTGYEAAVNAWNAGMSTGGPWAPFVAAAYTTASLAQTGALISKIGGGGGGGGGVSASSAGPTQQQQPQRQDPIQRVDVIENRGLAEVASLLRNLDPGAVFPAEYTQRIVASLEQNTRNGGGE